MARAWVLVIAATATFAACGDAIGPPPAERLVPDHALRQMRWSPAIGTPAFAARPGGSIPEAFKVGADQSALVTLDANQTSFWAYQGRDASVEIRYRAADGTWQPFAQLNIPAGGLHQYPNGQPFNSGDSVLITVTLDPQAVGAEFQPSGLAFSSAAPAQFRLWYAGADPDLDANGKLDGVDEQIRRTQLSVWVQENPGDPWAGVSAVHALDHKLFSAGLLHFSKYRGGYAISF